MKFDNALWVLPKKNYSVGKLKFDFMLNKSSCLYYCLTLKKRNFVGKKEISHAWISEQINKNINAGTIYKNSERKSGSLS